MRRQVTIKDIAQKVGISNRAVSLALNDKGRISKETRKQVLDTARELGYSPNMLAKGLVEKKTFMIGAIFPYLGVSFMNLIIAGMEKACIRRNYEIILCSSSSANLSMLLPDLSFEQNSVQRMILRRVDGIVCLPDPRAYSIYSEVVAEGIPLLQVLRKIPGLDAPYLCVDNELGAFEETKYLIDLGHTSVGFLRYNDSSFDEINSRYQGYLKALIKFSLSLDLERVTEPSDLTYEGGYRAAKALLARAPEITAIVAPTDYAALGTIQACSEAEKRVPEDISVVGFDDLDIARYQVDHPLTTVKQPKEEFGAMAFEMLYSLIKGEHVESSYMQPELVLRSSAAAPSGRPT